MIILRSFFFALLLAFTASANAGSDISISNAWARATAPGQQVAAAYMDIKSQAGSTLVKVESNLAGSVEIHTMTMENDVMKMRMLQELTLPAGEIVSLKPGGYHLMLFDLKNPLKAGEQGEFKLHFKNNQGDTSIVSATLPIQAAATMAH